MKMVFPGFRLPASGPFGPLNPDSPFSTSIMHALFFTTNQRLCQLEIENLEKHIMETMH
jgi:hypothetical protein